MKLGVRTNSRLFEHETKDQHKSLQAVLILVLLQQQVTGWVFNAESDFKTASLVGLPVVSQK